MQIDYHVLDDGSNQTIVAYVCDRQACGDRCTYPECRHTTDVNHAVNFFCIDTVNGKWIEKEVKSNAREKE